MSHKLQLYGFTAAVCLLVILVTWAARSAWQEFRVLRQNFGTVQTHSFHMAEHIEVTVAELNAAVLHFDSSKTPAHRAEFEGESEMLRRWFVEQRGFATTQRERDLLKDLEAAFEQYLLHTRVLFERQDDATRSSQPLIERLDEGKAPINELCSELREAERQALNRFVAVSHDALEALQRFLIALVVLLSILGFTATRLIYRVKIAPLRAQVVQSRALLERQEKLASLGTLAAGVAHEIRNPLTAINVRVHGLKKVLATGSSEHEDVTVIDEEIRRLDRIVRDFLDFARPSEPRLVSIPVESLFDRVQSLLAPQWKKASIRLHLELAKGLRVRVDPQQIEQVLINLAQNAAESIRQEGTVTLRARSGTARLPEGTLPAVLLEVVDTGQGISAEAQNRIFDPFYTTKEGGTGLGLAVAAGIVEKHGGLLQFQSQVGRGTTFTIALPRAKGPDDPS